MKTGENLKMNTRRWFIACLSLLLLTACGAPATPEIVAPTTEATQPLATQTAQVEVPISTMEANVPFELTSTAFLAGEAIPAKYSCDGEDISPPLLWGTPPASTQSFALIMDDPDAPVGTWVHWVVFNIPAEVRSLPEAMLPGMKFNDVAALFGTNSWGRSSYGGPCPPSGTHRYFFKLYALDTMLGLDAAAGKNQVLEAMEGHVLVQVELMGTYSH